MELNWKIWLLRFFNRFLFSNRLRAASFAVKSDWNERGKSGRDRRAMRDEAAICEQQGRQSQRKEIAAWPLTARRSHPLFSVFVPVEFHSKRETARSLVFKINELFVIGGRGHFWYCMHNMLNIQAYIYQVYKAIQDKQNKTQH